MKPESEMWVVYDPHHDEQKWGGIGITNKGIEIYQWGTRLHKRSIEILPLSMIVNDIIEIRFLHYPKEFENSLQKHKECVQMRDHYEIITVEEARLIQEMMEL